MTLLFPATSLNKIGFHKKTPRVTGVFYSGGEGGIRTREPLWVTRFPSVRAKPDYATSPYQAGELYHVKLTIKMVRPTISSLINY
jgi:hypothetical protein